MNNRCRKVSNEVAQAVKSAPEVVKHVLQMRYYDGLSDAEICAILNIGQYTIDRCGEYFREFARLNKQGQTK